MSDSQNIVIKPYDIERVCKPHPNIEQLVLKEVDNTESVYTRTLIKLKDAGLPALPSVRTGVEQEPGVDIVHWDLFLMLKYRQGWRPSGYGLGDLIYTMSLLPNEELTLEVKTWETEKRLEEVQTGVAEKNTSDIKQTSSTSSDVTNKAETKEHEYVDAKAGYAGFGASVSVSAGWSQDVNTMNQQIAKQAQERTQTAANEHTANHQVKMALSRESGSESKTTRKIKNINQAHTLNVNFFGVLKEYEVSLTLYDVPLVLLGKKVFIDSPARSEGNKKGSAAFLMLDGSGQCITWGQLIYSIQDVEWIRKFTQHYGVSPIQILREAWSVPLKEGALGIRDWWKTDPLTEQERISFQTTMLQYVRPTSGWVEPDENGEIRWAYEVIPGQEVELLKYLYQFVPFSPMQIVGILTFKGLDPKQAMNTFLASKPDEVMSVNVPRSTIIRAEGPFKGMAINKFNEEVLPGWVQHIVVQLDQAKRTKGLVNVEEKDHYKVTLPTQGVYADLALGVCSGVEDFYAIQRQFDLETKKLEIEKLKLEVEKLKIQNQQLQQSPVGNNIVIQDPPANSTLELNVGVPQTQAATTVKYEKTKP